MMELGDLRDPSAGSSGTPPKSPRPKTRSLSPRTGSALVEGNLGDILQATVRMLSPAQGSTQGPAHGVLGPPARLRGQSPAFDSQMGGLFANGGVSLSGRAGFGFAPGGDARAHQEMLSLPVDAFGVLQRGNVDLTGMSREYDRSGLGSGQVEAKGQDSFSILFDRGFKCLFGLGEQACQEIASEYCPCEGVFEGFNVFPGYYCLKHAYYLFEARRHGTLQGRTWMEKDANELMLRVATFMHQVHSNWEVRKQDAEVARHLMARQQQLRSECEAYFNAQHQKST